MVACGNNSDDNPLQRKRVYPEKGAWKGSNLRTNHRGGGGRDLWGKYSANKTLSVKRLAHTPKGGKGSE